MSIVQAYNRNEKKHTFLLDGLLFCYECKHKIGIREKNKGQYYMVCNNYRRNSKLNLCTSHGFNYNKLEAIVLDYIRKIFKEINYKKIELIIKKSKEKYNYEKILENLKTEIKLTNDNIDKMYIDKLNNKISEEMYERLSQKLADEVKRKKDEYINIKKIKENLKQNDSEKIEEIIRNFIELKEPTPELMKIIINKIEIHQDKQVELFLNFRYR